MNHYLYKPHVQGPEYITTPDLLVDRLYKVIKTSNGVDLQVSGVHELSAVPEVQCNLQATKVVPAYFLAAAGGGCLLSIGVECKINGSRSFIISRFAWRLKYINNHFAQLDFSINAGTPHASKVSMQVFASPSSILEQFTGQADQLPKGVMVCVGAANAVQEIKDPGIMEINLSDTQLNRSLTLRLSLLDDQQDQWNKRPLPRYSVGPTTEDVKHYI